MLLNNPILCTPIKDSQAVDINIACLFLNRVGCDHVIQNWIQQTARATIFAYQSNYAYPCVLDDYRDLASIRGRNSVTARKLPRAAFSSRRLRSGLR